MRIYVASPWACRVLAAGVAGELEEVGHEVTSTWLNATRGIHNGTVGLSPDSTQEEVEEHAQGDLNDIDRADIVLMLTGDWCRAQIGEDIPEAWLHTGGRHIESGYALARGKAVHILGGPENIFARAFSFQHRTVVEFLEFVASGWGTVSPEAGARHD